MQLGCPTEDERDKPMTVDALKEEILVNSGENTLLVFPEAKRLTTSIRYWLEDMISAGARVVCFARRYCASVPKGNQKAFAFALILGAIFFSIC